jgi:Tfp pilus assembly protein PilN
MDGILRSVPQGVWLTALDVQPIVATRAEQAAAPAAPGVIERLEQAKEQAAQSTQTPAAGRGQAAPKGKETRTVTEVTGYTVTLKGLAMSNFMVADLLDNLRKVASFKDVDLSVTERTEVEKVKVMNFTATWGIPL